MREIIKNFIINEYFLSILSIVSFVFSVVTFIISYLNDSNNKIVRNYHILLFT